MIKFIIFNAYYSSVSIILFQNIFSKISQEEFTHLIKFLDSLKTKFKFYKWLLTMSLPATNNFYDNYKDFDLRAMAKSVDWLNFIQNRFYNIKSLEENLRDAKFVEMNIRKFIARGVPANKTIIGMPFKGALFNTSFFHKAISYNDICNELNEHPAQWKRSYHNAFELSRLENQADNLTILFEDSRSIANKGTFYTT